MFLPETVTEIVILWKKMLKTITRHDTLFCVCVYVCVGLGEHIFYFWTFSWGVLKIFLKSGYSEIKRAEVCRFYYYWFRLFHVIAFSYLITICSHVRPACYELTLNLLPLLVFKAKGRDTKIRVDWQLGCWLSVYVLDYNELIATSQRCVMRVVYGPGVIHHLPLWR